MGGRAGGTTRPAGGRHTQCGCLRGVRSDGRERRGAVRAHIPDGPAGACDRRFQFHAPLRIAPARRGEDLGYTEQRLQRQQVVRDHVRDGRRAPLAERSGARGGSRMGSHQNGRPVRTRRPDRGASHTGMARNRSGKRATTPDRGLLAPSPKPATLEPEFQAELIRTLEVHTGIGFPPG